MYLPRPNPSHNPDVPDHAPHPLACPSPSFPLDTKDDDLLICPASLVQLQSNESAPLPDNRRHLPVLDPLLCPQATPSRMSHSYMRTRSNLPGTSAYGKNGL